MHLDMPEPPKDPKAQHAADRRRLGRAFRMSLAFLALLVVMFGVQGMIERRAALRGLPAIGLWAQVPHYVAAMPYPDASLVLLEVANRIGDLDLPTGDLSDRADASRARIDELIAQNAEHQAMLRQLEAQADEHATNVQLSATSGDELAAELERFLREQG